MTMKLGNIIEKMLLLLDINVKAITTDDLREYLTDYQSRSTVSKQSVDNVRRNLSSFFTWLEDENYILKSPVRRIHKIKITTSVKATYSDDEMERLRDSCKEIRDLAMIDLLSSTGMRVGELVLLNREDIDFIERECVVLGKGDKCECQRKSLPLGMRTFSRTLNSQPQTSSIV